MKKKSSPTATALERGGPKLWDELTAKLRRQHVGLSLCGAGELKESTAVGAGIDVLIGTW